MYVLCDTSSNLVSDCFFFSVYQWNFWARAILSYQSAMESGVRRRREIDVVEVEIDSNRVDDVWDDRVAKK